MKTAFKTRTQNFILLDSIKLHKISNQFISASNAQTFIPSLGVAEMVLRKTYLHAHN